MCAASICMSVFFVCFLLLQNICFVFILSVLFFSDEERVYQYM